VIIRFAAARFLRLRCKPEAHQLHPEASLDRLVL